MTLRAAILGVLSEKPATGYEMIKDFSLANSVIWPAPKGEIYRELAKLESDGFAARATQEGARRQRKWRITAKGRQELKRWLMAAGDYSFRYEPILRAAFLPTLEPDEILQRIAIDRDFFRSQLEQLKPLTRSPAPNSSTRRIYALPLAVEFYEAMLAWCDEAEKIARKALSRVP